MQKIVLMVLLFWRSCRYKKKDYDIDVIVKEVVRRGIHHITAPNLYFALSVYVKSYYHDVNVAWVFFASIENLDQ